MSFIRKDENITTPTAWKINNNNNNNNPTQKPQTW